MTDTITPIESEPEHADRQAARISELERELEGFATLANAQTTSLGNLSRILEARGGQSLSERALEVMEDRAELRLERNALKDQTLQLESTAENLKSWVETMERERDWEIQVRVPDLEWQLNEALAERAEKAEAESAAMRAALELCPAPVPQTFPDRNLGIAEHQRISQLRAAALAPNAGASLLAELVTLRAQVNAMTALIPATWYADRDSVWRLEKLIEQWRNLHEVNARLEACAEQDAAVIATAEALIRTQVSVNEQPQIDSRALDALIAAVRARNGAAGEGTNERVRIGAGL